MKHTSESKIMQMLNAKVSQATELTEEEQTFDNKTESLAPGTPMSKKDVAHDLKNIFQQNVSNNLNTTKTTGK